MKISDVFKMAASTDSSTLSDDAGVGFSRAYINCDYAIAAASYDEVLGM